MRKCLRCKNEMIEDLIMMVSNGECGYIETYIENTEKIKNLDKIIN